MSIYVQVASIEDRSLMDTVMTAYMRADNPDAIQMGIAATVGNEFFASVVLPLTSVVGVSVRQYDPVSDWGIGRGRVNSRFAYDGQDYLVQVDSHTMFYDGWDSYLLRAYELAMEETQNIRTILTGYLGKHRRRNGSLEEVDRWAGYPLYSTGGVDPSIRLRGTAVTKVGDFPDDQIDSKTKRFYPSNRVCGNFCMGNAEWAGYQGWTGKEVFWEEEVLPSISLLNEGFSLAFPNLPLPLTHMYWEDDGTRQVLDDMFEQPSDIATLTSEHIAAFVRGNYDACKKYARHAGYDLTTDTLSGIVMPKSYGFD